jgi:hypothetical protein
VIKQESYHGTGSKKINAKPATQEADMRLTNARSFTLKQALLTKLGKPSFLLQVLAALHVLSCL